MRCPKCGYFNLPGADQCGQCRQSLVQPSAPAPVAFDDIYPPRARNRSASEQWNARGGRPARVLRRGIAAAGERRSAVWQQIRSRVSRGPVPTRAQIAADLRCWSLASAAVIPGIGHMLIGLYRRGFALLAAAMALVAGILLIHLSIADVLVWALLGLMCYSVWDTSQRVFPQAAGSVRAGELRQARLALMSVALVFSTVWFVQWLASSRYPLVTMANQTEAPALQDGDSLVTQVIDPARLHRGEIVLADESFGGAGLMYMNEEVPYQNSPIVERVIGIAGDQIACHAGQILVNDHVLGKGALPLTYSKVRAGLVGDVTATVPTGSVCLWRPPLYAERDGQPLTWRQVQAQPFAMVPYSDIHGRVLAVFDPPEHRRWLR